MNPAKHLHDLMKSWSDPTRTASHTRRDDMTDMIQAAVCLDQISTQLDVIEAEGIDVSFFRQQFPEWVRLVFGYPNKWSEPSTNVDNAASQISALVGYCTQTHPQPAAERLSDFDAFLTQVAEALDDPAGVDLPRETRASVRAAILEARACLSHDLADLNAATERLLGAVTLAYVLAQNQEAKDKWARVLKDFVYPFAINVASGVISGGMLAQLGM